MKNLFVFPLVIATTLFGASCDSKPAANSANKAANMPVIKRGVAPVADSEIAVIEMEEPR